MQSLMAQLKETEELMEKPDQETNLSEGINDWLKNPRENLATAKINGKATDEERSEEGKCVMSELIGRAKENL